MTYLIMSTIAIVLITVFAIVDIYLGYCLVRDLWHEWRHKREIRNSQTRISEAAEQSCWYMTKRSMSSRFGFDAHFSGILLLPCGGRLVYLKEDADVTFRRLAAGKTDYDPTADIDRYAVVCAVGGGEPHECPAWDAVRRVIGLAKEKRTGYKASPVPEDVDVDSLDYTPRISWVHKYDDLASPFGYYVEPIGAAGVAEIVAAGEKCVHRREDGGAGANKGNDHVEYVHEG